MKVYITLKDGTSATGEYDVNTKQLVVLKDSYVSESIVYSTTFRGARLIEEKRKSFVKNRRVIKNITFTSASTAANFITGNSTNGLVKWKDKNGKKLKDIIAATEA